jgi:hypothetical protein
MLNLELERSQLRAFEILWNSLANANKTAKNYYCNPSAEDYHRLHDSLQLKINSKTWFLKDVAIDNCLKIIDKIHNSSNLFNIATSQTVYEVIGKELETEIASQKNSEYIRRTPEQVLEDIQNGLEQKLSNFDFFFVVEGIELQEITEINLSNIKILTFTQEIASELTRLHLVPTNEQDDEERIKEVEQYFRKGFLNQTCLQVTTYGDYETAYTQAYAKAKELINYLRYMICLLFHKRVTDNMIRINILFEAFSNSEKYCARREKDPTVILSVGRGLQSVQDFPIDKSRLEELLGNGFLDVFSSIINSHSRTEVKGLISTAIYWTGEAQNETTLDVAFLKYWTALECLFSEKDKVTASLIQGITLLNTYGCYEFREPEEIHQFSKAIEKLYDKRSEIIHQGMNYVSHRVITMSDVSEICKYTAWSILHFFDLHSKNYQTREEIRNLINFLANLKTRSSDR